LSNSDATSKIAIVSRLYGKYKTVKEVKEAKLREALRDYPALYWAKYYHVNTRNERMSFKGLNYLLELYKVIDKTPRMCVEKSVQMGLSELFIIQSHVEAGRKGLTVMYVMPKYELRNRFVNNRIYKLHKHVNAYRGMVLEAETKVHRTSLMHFGKGTLAFVGSNVESEFIEIPVDSAYVDEKDRCNMANLLMLPDRLSASPYKYMREISNPTVEGFGIDERYQASSQAHWRIKCPHCGEWFVPDFFKHVVRQVGHNKYIPRDKEADPDPDAGGVIRLIHSCGKPVDNLSEGEWVHSYLNKEWKGYQISKVYGRFASLRDLYRKWVQALGNDLKIQIFYNSDLGRPYSARGAKILREALDACKLDYKYPVSKVESRNTRFMGVDVGTKLHVILRERLIVGEEIRNRLLLAVAVPGFSQVAQLISEWKPKRIVIDAMPEIHKVMELKAKYSDVWSSRFEQNATSLVKHKKERELRMNRTAILDAVKQEIDLKRYAIPESAEFIDNGDYYEHMMSSTRILEVNESNPEKSNFKWVHTKPDHYFLAEAYCLQASMLVPIHDIFEFFTEQASISHKFDRRKKVYTKELSDSEKEEIMKLKRLTPQIVLSNLQRKYAEDTFVKPKKDYEGLGLLIASMYKTQGYIDVFLLAKIADIEVENVIKTLKEKGFKESKIKGQYVK